jgi:hypothetical protein
MALSLLSDELNLYYLANIIKSVSSPIILILECDSFLPFLSKFIAINSLSPVRIFIIFLFHFFNFI